jgi:uncharacterized GH25 family protein
MRKTAVFAVAAALFASRAAAHDFWIEPSNFRPAVGSTVAIRLFVGPGFQGEPFPRVPQLLSRFVLVSASGERGIPGRAGDDPAGTIRIEEAGLQIVGYRSSNYPVSIDAAKFEEYLKEEGLEKIAAIRARRGETGKPAREVFSRCAKALLDARAGGGGKTGFDRSLGFTLELVPERDPYALGPGRELPVRLLLDGKPLSGALVQALLHGDPGAKVAARTDRSGRAKVRLPRAGFWMIKAVEMGPAPQGVGADWQSLWASLTFDTGGANPVGKAP